jgi:hypothetical protein
MLLLRVVDFFCAKFVAKNSTAWAIKTYKRSDNDISDYLKCVFGIPFLKPEEVFDCFIDDLMTIKPININVDKFYDYLLKTHIEQDALFPPNI